MTVRVPQAVVGEGYERPPPSQGSLACVVSLSPDSSFPLFSHHTRHSVHIKATRSGPAVLCTADATYELKHVETTNALLLVPEGKVRRKGEV